MRTTQALTATDPVMSMPSCQVVKLQSCKPLQDSKVQIQDSSCVMLLLRLCQDLRVNLQDVKIEYSCYVKLVMLLLRPIVQLSMPKDSIVRAHLQDLTILLPQLIAKAKNSEIS